MSNDFNLNLKFDVSSGQVSEGIHSAEVTDAEVKANRAGDGQNLVLKFKILTPAEAGRVLTLHQSLKDSVAWKYTQVLAGLGVDVSKGEGKISRRALVGKKCRIVVKHTEFQGEMRAGVDNVLPADGGTAPGGAAASARPAQPAPARLGAKPATVGKKAQETEDQTGNGEDVSNDNEDVENTEQDLPF